MSSATQEALYQTKLLTDLGEDLQNPLTIYEDNMAAISMTKDTRFHSRCKHLSIKCHFVKDQVQKGMVNVKYCQTSEMFADFITKALPRVKFQQLCKLNGVISAQSS